MQYAKFGRTGLDVSRICLGMMAFGDPRWRPWILDEAATRPIFRRAVEQGINCFDTADMYSAGESERVTGRLVREFCRREEVVVSTKVCFPVDLAFKGGSAGVPYPRRPNMDGLSRKRLRHAVDASLQRLGTDYIDLYQVHRLDPQTPLEETMEALHDLVKAGKVLHLGASNMPAWQLAKAQQIARDHGWTPFCSMQMHYNLVYREEEREMIPLCRDQQVALVPWSPLARGFLAAAGGGAPSTRARTDGALQKYYAHPADERVRARLVALAQARGAGPAELAFAWLLGKGMATLAVGATRPEQLDQACAALDCVLGADEVRGLEEAYEPHPVIGY